MQITPAILTNDLILFKDLVLKLSFSETLDIDIIRPPFINNSTISIEDVKDILDFDNQCIGFHLMVDNPKEDLINLFNWGFENKYIRIYLHQESDLSFLSEFKWPSKWIKGIAVKLETEFKDLAFYNQYDEVQLMSIVTGVQGNPFNISVKNRVDELRSLGFSKDISLDGGINLDTLSNVKDLDINRISVGSYFQKSKNPKESYRIMEENLNK